MKNKTKAKLIVIAVFIILALFCIALTFYLYAMNDLRKLNITKEAHASFSNTYLVATSNVITPERIKKNTDLLDYCLWDESRDDMSKIGLQGEIGALQYKQKTWDWFGDKYNFDGDIHNRQDQIDLFHIAVAGGDGYHWTCWLKYYGLLKDTN